MNKNPITKLNELLLTLKPYEFSTFAFLIGLILCEGLNGQELEAIGNFYELIGQTILTLGAQVENMDNFEQRPNLNSIIDILKNKIDNLEEYLKKFKDL